MKSPTSGSPNSTKRARNDEEPRYRYVTINSATTNYRSHRAPRAVDGFSIFFFIGVSRFVHRNNNSLPAVSERFGETVTSSSSSPPCRRSLASQSRFVISEKSAKNQRKISPIRPRKVADRVIVSTWKTNWRAERIPAWRDIARAESDISKFRSARRRSIIPPGLRNSDDPDGRRRIPAGSRNGTVGVCRWCRLMAVAVMAVMAVTSARVRIDVRDI